mmetsp:Transcript_3332/g.5051  ORF Transcript_3332/g.5051 Transcript_3332/m.5051 type:complete len:87 (-) Transcript_3332:2693-2953(-)
MGVKEDRLIKVKNPFRKQNLHWELDSSLFLDEVLHFRTGTGENSDKFKILEDLEKAFEISEPQNTIFTFLTKSKLEKITGINHKQP